MSSPVEAFAPDWASPPGDTILDLIEERDWSQVELANRLGFSTKHLNQLVKGKVALTYETALKLERVLGTAAEFWMNREFQFRQQLSRLEAEKTYASWVDWLDEIPVKELKKLGIVENVRTSDSNKAKLVEKLLAFFGVASPQEWRSYYGSMSALFRRAQENQSDNGAISAWLRLGEIEAECIDAPKYNRSKFEKVVKAIREVTTLEPEISLPTMKRLCLGAGVKVLIVKSIPRSHVSGVARWLNGHSPIIQLSLYGKTNDKFWFTFFHEAAHILLHSNDKKFIFLDDVDFSSIKEEEVEANRWAADLMIPPEYRYDLLSLRGEGDILEFSKRINIHPGIVVGRLQHENQIRFSTALNRLKESFEIY